MFCKKLLNGNPVIWQGDQICKSIFFPKTCDHILPNVSTQTNVNQSFFNGFSPSQSIISNTLTETTPIVL
jgi:hypothetical protein